MTTLQELHDDLLSGSPFGSNRAGAGDALVAHAAEIHHLQARSLVELSNQALTGSRGIGVVLWGEPGIGKTHLLRSHQEWVRSRSGIFVLFHHPLVAGPELPRAVLRSVLEELTGGRTRELHRTGLFQLARWSVREAFRTASLDGAQRVSAAKALELHDRFVEERVLPDLNAGPHAGTVLRVLYRFYMSAHGAREYGRSERDARLAVRFLSGGSLSASQARRLGLPVSGEDALVRIGGDHEVEATLLVLGEVARRLERPFVLAIDQMDTMSEMSIAAIVRFQHVLLDHATNLLMITTGVRDRLLDLRDRGVIPAASWDRISDEEPLELARLDPELGELLVQVRIDELLEPFAGLPRVREKRARDPLFPLRRAWFLSDLGTLPTILPRDVIRAARTAWKREQNILRQAGLEAWLTGWSPRHESPEASPDPDHIDAFVGHAIRQRITEIRRDPTALPPDADHLRSVLLSLLHHCPGKGGWSLSAIETPVPSRRRTHDFVVIHDQGTSQERRVGVMILVTPDARTTTGRLKRVLADPAPPESVVMVCDARRPLALGNRGRELLARLESREAVAWVPETLSYLDLARLESLYQVVRRAREGKLTFPMGETSRALTAMDVIASNLRCDRYLSVPLLQTLLSDPSRGELEEGMRVALMKDLEEFILAQLALTPGVSSRELVGRYDGPCALPPARLRGILETVAMRLDRDRRLKATPQENAVYLLRV